MLTPMPRTVTPQSLRGSGKGVMRDRTEKNERMRVEEGDYTKIHAVK